MSLFEGSDFCRDQRLLSLILPPPSSSFFFFFFFSVARQPTSGLGLLSSSPSEIPIRASRLNPLILINNETSLLMFSSHLGSGLLTGLLP